ncbi:MAG: putative quinol monooxygenase [Lentilactobacillus diolivorans]|jgi:quinol monooxygenase YgiN|uniref:Antibiotic biosynthesis monooxygenase n=2 Tax=Lentilactobacillus diolivorans TaxID=179838 RepID=A0A0R1S276_9LACO|nr:putative quinol monooxygenase [Lentilactobacillus diolivorans]RRG04338.1 MAG: antibiotic biosynthesis monooxygenase [Lactobacillus sp.]KRL63200.1 antibiotic biosynthesis monooxygenase [Lentilactobacillus diolivorans DSM 14421]MCH4165160.1 antibiotic biosynthesis monooxygenase [Lentilactobacillus diolivorans]MDH5106665.1 antibiotic biosynthesis monooxygenase [Lentilactobacillus diolivorans]GEP24450.1 antibiotic biosynthesis monooxygenase [Lentilactobacillus diolivorans]
MKVINVELTVKPGMQKDYEAFIDKLVEGSRAETGNVSYNHFKKLGTDNEYEIIEHWQDADAVEFHNQTPHFQTFLSGVGQYLTKDPVIIRMDYQE